MQKVLDAMHGKIDGEWIEQEEREDKKWKRENYKEERVSGEEIRNCCHITHLRKGRRKVEKEKENKREEVWSRN